MSRNHLRIAFVISLLVCTLRASAEAPPRPPDLSVGISRFKRTDPSLDCPAESRIINRLETHGVRVLNIEPSVDVATAFLTHRDLDFVVTGSLSGGAVPTATAKIFARGNESPRIHEASGGLCCEEIISFVTQKVTDNHAIGKTLASREGEARAKLEREPDHFESLMTLGLSRRQAEDWVEAFPYFERAARVKPNNLPAQLNLALCFKARNDNVNWLLHLTNAERINPDDEGVLIALGNYYAETGERPRAVAYYVQAKTAGLNPDVACWNIAVASVEMRNLERALASLEEIPTSSLHYADARAWMAKLSDEKGKIDEVARLEAAPRKSMRDLLGLPDALAIMFVGISLAIFLSPYFGGKKLGSFEIPVAPPLVSSALKLVGPVLFLGTLSLFPPVLRQDVPPLPEPSPAPSVLEIEKNKAVARGD